MPPSNSDVLASVRSLAQECTHLTSKQCKEAVEEFQHSCCERGSDLTPEVCKGLITLVLSVVSVRNRDTGGLQWSCLQLVAQAGRACRVQESATRSELHTFFFKLAKAQVKTQCLWKPSVLVPMLQYILCWSTTAQLHEKTEDFSFDAAQALMQALYGEMVRCGRWSARWQLKARRALEKVLATPAPFLDHAVDFMKKQEGPALLIAAAGAICASKKGSQPHRVPLVELFVKYVLEAKQPVPDNTLQSWGVIVGLATSEDFEKLVLPSVVKVSKRTPAVAAHNVPLMVSQLTINLTPHAKGLLELLAIETLKVPERRSRGRLLVESVTRGSGEPPFEVVQSWNDALKKTGKADEKQAYLLGILAFVETLPRGAANLEKLADSKGGIAKVAGEDANEEVRSLGCRTLGALLFQAPQVADAVAGELAKTLADKKAADRVKIAALDVLGQALQMEATEPSWCGVVLEKVAPALLLASTKPAQRLQSLLAWSAFGTAATLCSTKVAALMKKDHNAVLKDGTSFINSTRSILRAPGAEGAAQTGLWRSVLCGQIGDLPSFGTHARTLVATNAVTSLPPVALAEVLPTCRTTIMLLAGLHSRAPERRESESGGRCRSPAPFERLGLLKALECLPEEEFEGLVLLLVHTLVSWLAELNSLPIIERSATPTVLRGVLLDLCVVASSTGKPLRPDTLSLLIVAAHHPLLGTASRPVRRLWAWLRSEGPLAKAIDSAPPSVWRMVGELIVNSLKLPLRDKTGFRFACAALAGAMDSSRGATPAQEEVLQQEVRRVLDCCCQSLHSADVAKESADNVSIYFAPEGQLWVEEGLYVAEERENKNKKQNKYLKDLYGDEDDISVETRQPSKFTPPDRKAKAKSKPSAKAAAEKAKTGGALTTEEIEAVKIEEQSQTRARIRAYADEAHFALDVLVTLSSIEANKEILEEALPDLVPHFIELLKSPITTLRARKALRALTNLTVSESVVLRKDLLPDALQVVSKNWLLRPEMTARGGDDKPICEIVLDGATTSEVMSPAAFSLILPVLLRSILHANPSIAKLCARSLFILEKQISLGAEVSEGTVYDVFQSLSTVLLSMSGQRDATQAAMCAACSNIISTPDQLTKLSNLFFCEDENVRSTVIAALAEVKENIYYLEDKLDPLAARPVLRLGALDGDRSEVAKEALEALDFEADKELLMEIIDFSNRKPVPDPEIQKLIAKAVAEVLEELDDPEQSSSALDALTQAFREGSGSRITVARCLESVFATNLDGEEQVLKAFRFLLRQALGITSSSTPENVELRDTLLSAGMGLIEKHGEENAEVLYAAIEEFEDSGTSAAAGESARLGVAVFLGALSKHLGQGHPKVPEILPRLLSRLLDPESTKSVQNAIVKVMPPLMKMNKDQANETLEHLLATALAKNTHSVTRRGAAMGLGATVKGLSIQAVSQHGILKKIEEAAENKKDSGIRQGALTCLEGLTLNLGRLFDPYVVSTLPLLLQAFSDTIAAVRDASQSAAKAMMSQLSGPGVKQILKPLLEGIKDKQWRTKLGSIELLAAMSSCLPKQLTTCLPQVVPALCVVINDQHTKVKDAARVALDKIGSIITSPELRVLAPDLIEALTDGAQFEHITKRVLDQLLGTSFVHHIDAPSLSLVCPLVQRALKERSAEMKRKGAQIVGSMVLLIKDPKDIQPYLPILLPQLKLTLVDPIPDVRATTAKAFGTLANELPEEMLGDVLPWLLNMLKSSESNVERSGAAHGLSEVLMAMGTDRIELLLPDILHNATNSSAPPEVKEGYLGLFVYLPVAMGIHFEKHIEPVLTALLRGIADDVGAVRDTAFKAAQVLVRHFGASHTSLLLPPLEEGVFDTDWQIRHSSVQLMGQLIEQILRAHRIPTQSAELMYVEVLPKEWRCHMLASLYIVRSDENTTVRQACQQVWKAVVQNTPRTLKELLPALMKRLIANLASTNREKQRVAARCVGDLVGKLGERVMPELMPIFMNTLSTGDAHVREGVCIGLAELINATTKQLLEDYLSDLIPAIRQAIIDDVEHVRNSASLVVALLHREVGPRATTDVVTWVLAQLQDEDVDEEENGELFLNGLEQLMSKQPAAVLPIMLKRLTVPAEGWTRAQIQGLSSLAVVPDAHMVHSHLSDVLPVLIGIASDDDERDEIREAAIESAKRVMDRVEQNGLFTLFNELKVAMDDKVDPRRRASGARLFEIFFESTQLDVAQVLALALPSILPSALADTDSDALASGVKALNGIVKKCKKEELAPYLPDVRDTVLRLVTDPDTGKEVKGKLLPGLCKQNGLEPLYPIYQHGLMFGSAEARELAAKGLGELVNHTTEEALKPYVVKITGPLIRIVGDRFPGSVKKAIVDTLKSLLIKGGAMSKPFLPQLQTTYVKCLSDSTEAVRTKAAESLGTLVRLSQRNTEPLINELTNNVATHADAAARLSMGVALGEVLLNVPTQVSEAAQDKLLDALLPRALENTGDSSREREVAAWALALVLRRHVSEDRALSVLEESVASALVDGPAVRRDGAARVLAGVCWCQPPQLEAPPAELCTAAQDLVKTWLPKLLSDPDPFVQTSGAVVLAAAARLSLSSPAWEPLEAALPALTASLAAGKLNPTSVLASSNAARQYAKAATEADRLVSMPNIVGQVAAAVAVRGVEKSCEVPEVAERAVAALLGLSNDSGDAEAKAAIERVTSRLDPVNAKTLREFASKRVRVLADHAKAEGGAEWDF